MPTTYCPRCHAQLREEDCVVYSMPHDPAWESYESAIVQVSCWCCTWKGQWHAKDLSQAGEKVLP